MPDDADPDAAPRFFLDQHCCAHFPRAAAMLFLFFIHPLRK